ncbi:MAG: hypothetical protein AAF555_02005 [Verrucomicrobiota bacterium]
MKRFLLLLTVLGFSWSLAQEREPEEAEEPAPEALSHELEKIRAYVSKRIYVTGQVVETSRNQGGFEFLHFDGDRSFLVVISPDDVPKFGQGGPIARYQGEWIRFYGEVERFADSLQIRITSPEQVKIATEASASRLTEREGSQ